MKVTTDGCLFGAWVAERVGSSELRVRSRTLKVLDIGTGTGLLALMLAQKNATANIDAIEIDQDAARQAEENIAASPWKDRIRVVQEDVRTFSSRDRYDFIISNPPFYENELRSDNNQKNIAHHSDELPLEELLKTIKKHLLPGGTFFLLLPFKRNNEIKELLFEHDYHIQQICFVRQSPTHSYFRIMVECVFSEAENAETIIDEISITGKEQAYTQEFTGLLKEYYLNLK
jgi:tRNA1Val (adenine37-N6)-methyltransferase